jgi:predicted nucleotidyltransferase
MLSLPPDHAASRIAAALGPIQTVRVAYLFGSRGTGRPRPDSDLDVAVAWARGLGDEAREVARREVIAALTDALGALGERADIVDLYRADSAVGFRAIRDGLRVVSRSELERIELEVRIARRYDDDAPKRELFRNAALRVARRLGEPARGKP